MKSNLKISLLVLLLVIVLSGCSLVYKVLLGVDTKPNWSTDKHITSQAKKYKIPEEFNLIQDTVGYYEELKVIYQSKFDEVEIIDGDSTDYFKLHRIYNDDFQPVQFRLFDNEGTEIFKMVNCYVDPPIPMNWNVGGCFDNFPAKTNIESLNTHFFGLEVLLENASFLNSTKLTMEELPNSDYYGVIIWNDFFKRPSKKLIKTVQKYVQKRIEKVTLIYIYNHNSYLWYSIDSDTRMKVKEASNNK